MEAEVCHRIVVASKNPVKAGAIEGAFQKLFPDRDYAINMVSVESGVPDQPMSDEETLRGARNRMEAARIQTPDAHIWAGLEGGVAECETGMNAFAWIVCRSADHQGESRTATFPLPPAVAQLIRDGMELGHADDVVFGRENSKQKEGAIGILSAGTIDRRELYEMAAIMAMIPLRNAELFK